MSRIMLAPMEGVVDAPMREFITDIGGYDRCVTEFIRVIDQTYPNHLFTRFCPELTTDGMTTAGVPVFIQLLGSNPEAMAKNALRVAHLGAQGIDINFGCPSKTVNNRDGGSTLLQSPERIKAILHSVREALPYSIPVTAKIRLGFENSDNFAEIIDAIRESGIDELCVHARTKKHGYKPPAYWSTVKEATEILDIPVIINGEIWSVSDAHQAQTESHCSDVMIGRGAIACPDLALQIKKRSDNEQYTPMQWPIIWEKVKIQAQKIHRDCPRYSGMRTKQWLRYLALNYPEAEYHFEQIKRCKTVADMMDVWHTNNSSKSR